MAPPAGAAESPDVEVTADRKGLVFPPRLRKRAEPSAAENTVAADRAAPEEAPSEEAASEEMDPVDAAAEVSVDRIVAIEPPTDGIWEFVEQMGEAPTDQQVAAIEERAAAELSEKALIDDLSVGEPPMDFYRDPEAVLSADPLFLDRVDPSEFDIPVVVNADVERWVKYFTTDDRKY